MSSSVPHADSVGISPNGDAIIRLIGAVLAEQTDEWAEGRRHLCLELLTRWRLTAVFTTENGTATRIGADTVGAALTA